MYFIIIIINLFFLMMMIMIMVLFLHFFSDHWKFIYLQRFYIKKYFIV